MLSMSATYGDSEAVVSTRSYRSMKKNEAPHSLNSIPHDVTCTMMSQWWSVPRGKDISPQCVDALMVKKPREGANYDKFNKSTLYSSASQYHLLGPEQKAKLKILNPEPLLWSLLPDRENLEISQLPSVQTKFGAPKGSVLSYQKKAHSEICHKWLCPHFIP